MRVVERIDELHVYPHLVIRFLHAALHDMHHAKLLRDFTQIGRRALEPLRRCARDDFQIRHLCQPGQNFILHAFGEVGIRFVVA